jgi:HlyD family secretion protein
VRRGDLSNCDRHGDLAAAEQYDVGASFGTIKTVEADYNSKVKAGQVLARLDTMNL